MEINQVEEKAGGMDARTVYFRTMQDIIYRGTYLLLLSRKFHKQRRTWECVLALTSSTFLAIWLAWSDLALLASIFIVATQIISSLLPLMGVAKKDTEVKETLIEFQPLRRYVVSVWWEIEFNNLPDDEIIKKIQLLKKHEFRILNKLLMLEIEDDEKVRNAAAKRTDEYTKATFMDIK